MIAAIIETVDVQTLVYCRGVGGTDKNAIELGHFDRLVKHAQISHYFVNLDDNSAL